MHYNSRNVYIRGIVQLAPKTALIYWWVRKPGTKYQRLLQISFLRGLILYTP